MGGGWAVPWESGGPSGQHPEELAGRHQAWLGGEGSREFWGDAWCQCLWKTLTTTPCTLRITRATCGHTLAASHWPFPACACIHLQPGLSPRRVTRVREALWLCVKGSFQLGSCERCIETHVSSFWGLSNEGAILFTLTSGPAFLCIVLLFPGLQLEGRQQPAARGLEVITG